MRLKCLTRDIADLYLGIFQRKRQQFLCDIFQLNYFLHVGPDFRLILRIRIRVDEQRRKWMLYVKRFPEVTIELSLSTKSRCSWKWEKKYIWKKIIVICWN